MYMKTLLTEWKRYLTEIASDNFDHNISKIIEACEATRTSTSVYFNELVYFEQQQLKYDGVNVSDPNVKEQIRNKAIERIKEILINAGAEPILKNYRIKDLLAAGSIGFAFNLEEPHEDYVLKLQITYRNVGTHHIMSLYKRQEQGEFKPNEVRVLEAIESEPFDYMGKKYKANLFVVSKVDMKYISGKTGNLVEPDEAMSDLYQTRATDLIELLMNLKTTTDSFQHKIMLVSFKKLSGLSEQQINKLIELYDKNLIEHVARLFYKFNEQEFLFLSRDQFVALFKEYHDRAIEARDAGVPFDFHGGNFGYRKKSDVPLPFDAY